MCHWHSVVTQPNLTETLIASQIPVESKPESSNGQAAHQYFAVNKTEKWISIIKIGPNCFRPSVYDVEGADLVSDIAEPSIFLDKSKAPRGLHLAMWNIWAQLTKVLSYSNDN